MNNNVSFQSRIRFVDKKTFINTVTGKRIDHIERPIAFVDDFFTNCIRSCSAGAIVAPHKEVYAYHIFDGKETHKTIYERLTMDIKLFDTPPKHALIIGGKEHSTRPFSIPNFKIIKDLLRDNIDNVSYFEQHTDYYAQSSLHYDKKNDVYTILTQFFNNGKEDYIKTIKDLLCNFKKIRIAKGDELFIGGLKINPIEYSSIFEK